MQNPEQITHLRELALQVRDFQTERGLSDQRLYAELPDIGSTKTYKKILDEADELEELNLKNQVANYERAIAEIKDIRAKATPTEVEYPDFSNIIIGQAAVARALREQTIARYVSIEGENGTGKDAVLNSLVVRWPKLTTVVEATERWRFSNATPARDLLLALGVTSIPHMPEARWEIVEKMLQESKRVLVINEAHHMGCHMLNNIKTLINKTKDNSRLVIVGMCVPKLIRDLETKQMETARQLFENRLCARVELPAPSASEIGMLMERRGVSFAAPEDRKVVTTEIAADAPGMGNWRYVSLVTREARDSKATNYKDIRSAMERVKSRRITHRNRIAA